MCHCVLLCITGAPVVDPQRDAMDYQQPLHQPMPQQQQNDWLNHQQRQPYPMNDRHVRTANQMMPMQHHVGGAQQRSELQQPINSLPVQQNMPPYIASSTMTRSSAAAITSMEAQPKPIPRSPSPHKPETSIKVPPPPKQPKSKKELGKLICFAVLSSISTITLFFL